MLNVMVSCFQIYPVHVLQTNNQTVRYFKSLDCLYDQSHYWRSGYNTQHMNHKLVPILLVVQLSYARLPFSLRSKYKYVENTTLAPIKPNLLLKCVTKWPFLGIEEFYNFNFMGKSKIFFTMDVFFCSSLKQTEVFKSLIFQPINIVSLPHQHSSTVSFETS